jgi:hypothetical protein
MPKEVIGPTSPWELSKRSYAYHFRDHDGDGDDDDDDDNNKVQLIKKKSRGEQNNWKEYEIKHIIYFQSEDTFMGRSKDFKLCEFGKYKISWKPHK